MKVSELLLLVVHLYPIIYQLVPSVSRYHKQTLLMVLQSRHVLYHSNISFRTPQSNYPGQPCILWYIKWHTCGRSIALQILYFPMFALPLPWVLCEVISSLTIWLPLIGQHLWWQHCHTLAHVHHVPLRFSSLTSQCCATAHISYHQWYTGWWADWLTSKLQSSQSAFKPEHPHMEEHFSRCMNVLTSKMVEQHCNRQLNHTSEVISGSWYIVLNMSPTEVELIAAAEGTLPHPQ